MDDLGAGADTAQVKTAAVIPPKIHDGFPGKVPFRSNSAICSLTVTMDTDIEVQFRMQPGFGRNMNLLDQYMPTKIRMLDRLKQAQADVRHLL